MALGNDWNYGKTEAGIYKGGVVFSTHDAEFYLDENKKIVGVKCDKILSNGGEPIDLEITKQGENYSVRWGKIDAEYSKDTNSKITQITSFTKAILEELLPEGIQNQLNVVSKILLA